MPTHRGFEPPQPSRSPGRPPNRVLANFLPFMGIGLIVSTNPNDLRALGKTNPHELNPENHMSATPPTPPTPPTSKSAPSLASTPKPTKGAGSSAPDILLDAGTNELEVLVFSIGSGKFGVNVAKVREVIRPVTTVESPGQHPSVIGIFNIRGSVIPVVDLAKHLSLQKAWGTGANAPEGRIIITEFNGRRTGFMVDQVEQIYRMSWSKVRPAPDVGASTTGVNSATTGIIEIGGHLVLMVDFESVSDAILLQEKLRVESVPNDMNVDRGSKRVILCEDSPFMRHIMSKVLRQSGYTRLEVFSDGEQAWQAISAGGDRIDAVVSDIEMPRMDGLHLTKRIKSGDATKGIPVILFSSLISEDNRKKGQQVGADVQIPKPELPEMVRLVDKVVSGIKVGIAQASDTPAPPRAAAA